jgi:radical SAM superfamily enzyme YgiQ (UPF0313 family)
MMSNSKNTGVLLISPKVTSEYTKTYPPELSENLGLGYLGGYLEFKGVPVEIVDFNSSNLDLSQVVSMSHDKDYVIIGISGNSPFYLADAMKFATSLKKQGVRSHITLGGHCATFRDQEVLSTCLAVDSIVRGEGELTLHELYEALRSEGDLDNIDGLAFRVNGEVRRTKTRPAIQELDTIPFPKRYNMRGVTEYNDSAHILTSRGCPGKCSFCVVPLHKGWRARSASNVLEEIVSLIELGAKAFVIDDENYIGHCKEGRERAIEIADKIIERGLKIRYKVSLRADDLDPALLDKLAASGLSKVNIGIESFNQRQLDFYNKNLSPEQVIDVIERVIRKGLDATFSFIMFDPYVTPEELQVNHDHIRKYSSHFNFKKTRTYLKPVKGSVVWKTLKRDGLLVESEDFNDKYAFVNEGGAAIFKLMEQFRGDMKALEREYEQFSSGYLLLKRDKSILEWDKLKKAKKEVETRMTSMWLDILQFSINQAETGTHSGKVEIPANITHQAEEIRKIFENADVLTGGKL